MTTKAQKEKGQYFNSQEEEQGEDAVLEQCDINNNKPKSFLHTLQ